MFWKKKQMARVAVGAGPAVATGITPPATKVEVTSQPKAQEPRVVKLPRPKLIPGLVEKHLIAEHKIDPDLVRILKAVVRGRPESEHVFDIRVFDESEALAKKVQVKNYSSLDEHPDLTIYEGRFDEVLKKVELEEKKKISSDTIIFTEAEIRQKIEALNQPGSTVFFYNARGSTYGGPLGMGAAVIELNPNYPGKKQKKYNVYLADVIDMQPEGKGGKIFDSDEPKNIARWVKERHEKRMY